MALKLSIGPSLMIEIFVVLKVLAVSEFIREKNIRNMHWLIHILIWHFACQLIKFSNWYIELFRLVMYDLYMMSIKYGLADILWFYEVTNRCLIICFRELFADGLRVKYDMVPNSAVIEEVRSRTRLALGLNFLSQKLRKHANFLSRIFFSQFRNCSEYFLSNIASQMLRKASHWFSLCSRNMRTASASLSSQSNILNIGHALSPIFQLWVWSKKDRIG